MDCRLLVPDQNMLEPVLFEHCVIDVQNRAARIAEHKFDLFVLQASDYNFRTSQNHLIIQNPFFVKTRNLTGKPVFGQGITA